MPFKSEKIKLVNTEFDRRRKLSVEEKIDIHDNVLGLSQRKLALMYKVSRRTIQFILDPDKLKENLKRRKERGGSKIYYVKEKHTETMRNHRNYKQQLSKKL